jgi:hypothetical protein
VAAGCEAVVSHGFKGAIWPPGLHGPSLATRLGVAPRSKAEIVRSRCEKPSIRVTEQISVQPCEQCCAIVRCIDIACRPRGFHHVRRQIFEDEDSINGPNSSWRQCSFPVNCQTLGLPLDFSRFDASNYVGRPPMTRRKALFAPEPSHYPPQRLIRDVKSEQEATKVAPHVLQKSALLILI